MCQKLGPWHVTLLGGPSLRDRAQLEVLGHCGHSLKGDCGTIVSSQFSLWHSTMR